MLWLQAVGTGKLQMVYRAIYLLWLVLSSKLEQNLGKLVVIAQILSALGSMLKSFLFDFPDCLHGLRARVLLSYVLWPLSLFMFCLSQRDSFTEQRYNETSIYSQETSS